MLLCMEKNNFLSCRTGMSHPTKEMGDAVSALRGVFLLNIIAEQSMFHLCLLKKPNKKLHATVLL